MTFGQFASATPELYLVSGGTNVTVPGSGSTVNYSNTNFDGWNISVVFGSSNSPGLTGVNGLFGLDITSLTATCSGGPCSSNPLDIFLSDTGFTQVVAANGFTSSYSTTQHGGSTSQLAWDTTANTIFGEGQSIGTIGPFTGTNHGSVSGGGPAGPSPYSLTIEDIFNANGSAASFSTDGDIAAVPEPAAISLLGGVLLVLGNRLRKRLG
jgi:hypothetical protein